MAATHTQLPAQRDAEQGRRAGHSGPEGGGEPSLARHTPEEGGRWGRRKGRRRGRRRGRGEGENPR